MADEQLELRMDPASLYREETFTDRRIGVIRMMTPVKTDGSIDLGRPILYVGEAQLLSPVGALPITFEIEATSLGDAAEKFSAGAKVAVERAIRCRRAGSASTSCRASPRTRCGPTAARSTPG